MKLNSATLTATAILALTLLVAAFIAWKGDEKPTVTKDRDSVPVFISGTTPIRHKASEASAVPMPEQAQPMDKPAPLPNNWR